MISQVRKSAFVRKNVISEHPYFEVIRLSYVRTHAYLQDEVGGLNRGQDALEGHELHFGRRPLLQSAVLQDSIQCSIHLSL